MTGSSAAQQVRTVETCINYAIDSGGTNRFHAKDRRLDTFEHDTRKVTITDGRTLPEAPTLEREGFGLFELPSQISDFRDLDAVKAVHFDEVTRSIAKLVEADETVIAGPPALRFGDKAVKADRAAGSKVAQLAHSDTYRTGTADFTAQFNPHPERNLARTAHHNIWRTFSPAPQDWPLALCDFRSVSPRDIVPAEAAFDDENGNVSWTFEAMLFAFNPAHRWTYWSNMRCDEVLVFKRHDSDETLPWFVPHTAFADPSAPANATPRASIELRTISYWYE